MDFFQQQDIARRNSRLLVVLFLLAVLALIALTNAAFAAFLYFGEHSNVYSGYRGGARGFLAYFSWARFGKIGLAITGTVAVVSLAHWVRLSRGGAVVAEGLGGTRIQPQSRDPPWWKFAVTK